MLALQASRLREYVTAYYTVMVAHLCIHFLLHHKSLWHQSSHYQRLRGMLNSHGVQVRMGFPQRRPEGPDSVALIGKECTLLSGGFTCPRCLALVAELPSSCHVCGLTLVSSPHLARSYHHLFPIKPFTEVTAEALRQALVSLLALSPMSDVLQSHVPCPMCFKPLMLKLLISCGVSSQTSIGPLSSYTCVTDLCHG